MATVSLALGIAAVCCVLSLLGRGLLAFLLPWPWPLRLAVVGWVTGWFALGTGAASGRRRGWSNRSTRRRALTGVWLGVVATVLPLVLVLVLLAWIAVDCSGSAGC